MRYYVRNFHNLFNSIMPQGKLKVKTQLPAGAKKKSGRISKNKKHSKPKKSKVTSHRDSIHQALEKAIREDIEDQARAKATSDGKPLETGKASGSGSAKKGKKK